MKRLFLTLALLLIPLTAKAADFPGGGGSGGQALCVDIDQDGACEISGTANTDLTFNPNDAGAIELTISVGPSAEPDSVLLTTPGDFQIATTGNGAVLSIREVSSLRTIIEALDSNQLVMTPGMSTGDIRLVVANDIGIRDFGGNLLGNLREIAGTNGLDWSSQSGGFEWDVGDDGQDLGLTADGLVLGPSGTAIQDSFANSAVIDFASISDTTADSSAITVTGAALGDVCTVGHDVAATEVTGSNFTCYVSAADAVIVRHSCNGTCNPGSDTFRVRVFDP